MIKFISLSMLISVTLLGACNAEQGDSRKALPSISGALAITPAPRVTDKKLLDQGKSLYQKNCSMCHGKNAEATSDWKTPGADGKYPPPPLNGTAHAWHHPTEVLMEVIKEGTLPDGNMPAWEGKLSDSDILAIIAWFQSLWSEEIFKTWQEIDLGSRED